MQGLSGWSCDGHPDERIRPITIIATITQGEHIIFSWFRDCWLESKIEFESCKVDRALDWSRTVLVPEPLQMECLQHNVWQHTLLCICMWLV